MQLLLDTHVLLWWLDGSWLAPEAGRAVAAPDNVVFVSAASSWEISIKQALGELVVTGNVLDHIGSSRFEPLPITLEHGLAAGGLLLHHADPFDRMLIAQAQVERLTVVTRDPKFRLHDVPVIIA